MKLNKIFSLTLGVAMLSSLASCTDDEVITTPLDAPVVTSTSTFKSIDCTWKAVDGAVKYGYELYDAYGNLIVRDVTQDTKVTFTGLNYASDYTLNIWAYGVYLSSDGTSQANTFDLRTNDLQKLATPVLTITNPSDNSVKITWDEVENAEEYAYFISLPNGLPYKSGTTTDTKLIYTGLTATGTYKLTVTATTTQEGFYGSSETATGTFEIKESDAPPAPVPN
jgi:hypothetical protein